MKNMKGKQTIDFEWNIKGLDLSDDQIDELRKCALEYAYKRILQGYSEGQLGYMFDVPDVDVIGYWKVKNK